VVVQGSGGVALFALQFAKMAGARVIATTGSPEKAMKLKEMGASEVVDRSEANWGKQIHELTSGGADLLVEVAGGDLDQSLQSLKVGGRLCLVGALSRQPVRFPTAQMIYANRHIDGITVGSRQHQEQMVKAIEANGLKPVIDKVYSLTKLGMAFASFEAQQHFGKIAIICSEQP
jgi:NADPH:quinone reductase-like Zn-dependent oxidoreductase